MPTIRRRRTLSGGQVRYLRRRSPATTTTATPLTMYRGINLSGAEFAHDADHLPGVANTDYMYPPSSDYTTMFARGHRMIRLPFRWERIQPTLGGALNTAELARLTAAVSAASAAGLKVLLDVHNYARFINSTANGGAELALGSGLTTAQLTDLWTRLSTAFKGNAGVLGYGLMNEPHSLTASPGTFTGTSRYDWNDGTVQGWTGDTATSSNVSSKLNLAATATAGFFQFRKDDGGTKRGGTLTGNVLSTVVTLASGVPGSWVAKVQWQNASYQWQTAGTITYRRVDTGAVVSGLIAGVAVQVVSDFTSAPITNANAFAVQIESNNATAGAVSATVDDFAQGSLSGAQTAAQVWQAASQACVTAIRNNSDTTRIFVPGYQFSGAQNWATNHPTPWITDPAGAITYEAHYYFDIDNSGTYAQSYSAANSAAVAAGFASLQARALSQIGVFTSWCTANSVTGFVGEIGWHNQADTASWNAIGNAVYAALDTAGIGASYWAAGEWYGATYNLSAYTGAGLTTLASPASVIEAHPSGNLGSTAPASDTTAPTTPTGVTASAITSTGFTLSWTASADAVGVTGYDVQIGGVSYATPTATTVAVTGRAASTAYSVRVRARDAAGNWSALSTAISVTTSAAAVSTMNIGVNVHPLWSDYSVTTLDKLQAAGVQHVRADFGWSDIQPNNATSFDGYQIAARIDPFFAACASRGIKVLAMLYKPPFWSSGSGTASNPAKGGIPANPADFGRVVAWFVDRYKANLSAVEMFNEMDIATFSVTRSAADYVRVMKGGYAGGGGRGVPLVAGAATYLGLATNWLADAYAAGLATGTGDALAIHPYMSPSNVAPSGNSSGSARKWSIVGIADVLALQAANGDTKPLWATEFGWSSHSNTGSEANYQIGVTEAQQAQYLTDGFNLLKSLGVKGSYWYSDRNTTETLVHEANFGLMNYNFTAKPAYTAIAALTAASAPAAITHGFQVTTSNVGVNNFVDPTLSRKLLNSDLTVHTNAVSASDLTTAGGTIRKRWFKDLILIDIDNVTFEGCRFDHGVSGYRSGIHHPFTLNWCTVEGSADPTGYGSVYYQDYTLYRCYIACEMDGLKANGGVTATECVIRTRTASPDDHNDGVQSTGSYAGNVIQRCNIDATPLNGFDPTGPGGPNAALFVADASSGLHVWTDNFVAGGGYVIRCYENATYNIQGNWVLDQSWAFGPVARAVIPASSVTWGTTKPNLVVSSAGAQVSVIGAP